MIEIIYEDEAIESLITKGESTDKRYKKLKSNKTFKEDLKKVMQIIRSVSNTKELSYFGQLKYEGLKHGLSGLSSVRVGYNAKYRLIFQEYDKGIKIKLIEINEHYGDK